jgi:hypothetical protein
MEKELREHKPVQYSIISCILSVGSCSVTSVCLSVYLYVCWGQCLCLPLCPTIKFRSISSFSRRGSFFMCPQMCVLCDTVSVVGRDGWPWFTCVYICIILYVCVYVYKDRLDLFLVVCIVLEVIVPHWLKAKDDNNDSNKLALVIKRTSVSVSYSVCGCVCAPGAWLFCRLSSHLSCVL